MSGLTIGIIGLALCVIACGVGSGLGLKMTGSASAGVLAEDPSKFSKVIVLSLLPATQGIYGFVIAVLGANYLAQDPSGWSVFFAALPMTIGGCASAILQGKTAATTIMAVGKRDEIASKSLIFPAMIEFYALLGLVVSILLFGKI